MLPPKKLHSDRIFHIIFTLIVFGIFFTLVYYLRTVLIPFVIALLLADVLDPAVDFFERFRLSRSFSIVLVFLLILVILFLTLFWGIPYIIEELSQFSAVFPEYITNIYNYLSKIFGEHVSKENVEQIVRNIQSSQIIERLLISITNAFSKILNLFYFLVAGVIIILYTFYLLKDIDRIRERWILYVPEAYRGTIQMFMRDSYYFITTFFRGQLIIVTIMGVLFSIGFSIIDIRLAIVLGFTAGFLNLIPNFGTIIAIIPAVLLAIGRALETGGNPVIYVIGVIIVFTIVQIIQDVILTPTIMGKKTGLRPATILLSVFIWGKLLGFLGIILAIPLTCLTKVYFSRFILHKDMEVSQ